MRISDWSSDVCSSDLKDGQQKTFYIYNVCDHEDAYAETGNQAVSYTTGVPAMIGAAMILTGAWEGKGVFNMEQFDPDPFMDMLNKQIGRASCRERVCQYGEISVVAVSLKKKQTK